MHTTMQGCSKMNRLTEKETGLNVFLDGYDVLFLKVLKF